jgi:hypothetical protein
VFAVTCFGNFGSSFDRNLYWGSFYPVAEKNDRKNVEACKNQKE